jgi:hypothetical protein
VTQPSDITSSSEAILREEIEQIGALLDARETENRALQSKNAELILEAGRLKAVIASSAKLQSNELRKEAARHDDLEAQLQRQKLRLEELENQLVVEGQEYAELSKQLEIDRAEANEKAARVLEEQAIYRARLAKLTADLAAREGELAEARAARDALAQRASAAPRFPPPLGWPAPGAKAPRKRPGEELEETSLIHEPIGMVDAVVQCSQRPTLRAEELQGAGSLSTVSVPLLLNWAASASFTGMITLCARRFDAIELLFEGGAILLATVPDSPEDERLVSLISSGGVITERELGFLDLDLERDSGEPRGEENRATPERISKLLLSQTRRLLRRAARYKSGSFIVHAGESFGGRIEKLKPYLNPAPIQRQVQDMIDAWMQA